jgi:hypothetical protein
MEPKVRFDDGAAYERMMKLPADPAGRITCRAFGNAVKGRVPN